MGPNLRSGILRALGAAVLFGLAAPAASQLAGSTSAFTLAGLLYLGAALAVAPAVIRTPPTRPALQQARTPLLIAVIAGGAIGPVLLMAGLARTTAATGSLLLNTELAATAVLGALFFRDHLSRRVMAGIVLITAAGVLLTWEPGARLDIGALLIIAACVAWGLDNCVTAIITHLTPAQVVAVKGLLAGSANLVLGLVLNTGGIGLSAFEILAALAIGAGGYGASIVLWVQGAHRLGATRAQVIFTTAPFIGALAAWIVLGDTVTAAHLVATVLAIAGVAIATTFDRPHEHMHEHDDGIVHSHPHVPDIDHRHSH